MVVNAKLLIAFKGRLDKYLEIRSVWNYCINELYKAEAVSKRAHSLGVYFKEVALSLFYVFPGCPLKISDKDMTIY